MSIVQEIITGGASCKKNGGKILTFPRPRKESMIRIVYGDRTVMSIREKISNWRTFVDVYWKENGTLDKNSLSSLKDVLFSIFCVKFECEQSEIIQILEGIFSLSNDEMMHGIGKSYHLNEPIVLSFRVNFMIWRDHLEELVMRFNEARTKYIKKNKGKEKINDIPTLLENWRKYDEKYDINSSSKLLLFSNLPSSPSDLPHIKHSKLKWSTHMEKFHWSVGKKTQNLEEKLLEFCYHGFCPLEPLTRFNKLLKFPIAALLEATRALGGEPPKADYCDMLKSLKSAMVTPKFREKIPNLNVKKIPQLKKKYKMKSKTSFDNNNLVIRWYIDQYIELCKQTKPYFIAKEKYYLEITNILNTVGFVVKKCVYRRRDT